MANLFRCVSLKGGSNVIEGVVSSSDKEIKVYDNGTFYHNSTLGSAGEIYSVEELSDRIKATTITSSNSCAIRIIGDYFETLSYDSVRIKCKVKPFETSTNNVVIRTILFNGTNRFYNSNDVTITKDIVNNVDNTKEKNGTNTNKYIQLSLYNGETQSSAVSSTNFGFELYELSYYGYVSEVTCNSFKQNDIIHFTTEELDVSSGLVVNGTTYEVVGADTLDGEVYIQFGGEKFHVVSGSYDITDADVDFDYSEIKLYDNGTKNPLVTDILPGGTGIATDKTTYYEFSCSQSSQNIYIRILYSGSLYSGTAGKIKIKGNIELSDFDYSLDKIKTSVSAVNGIDGYNYTSNVDYSKEFEMDITSGYVQLSSSVYETDYIIYNGVVGGTQTSSANLKAKLYKLSLLVGNKLKLTNVSTLKTNAIYSLSLTEEYTGNILVGDTEYTIKDSPTLSGNVYLKFDGTEFEVVELGGGSSGIPVPVSITDIACYHTGSGSAWADFSCTFNNIKLENTAILYHMYFSDYTSFTGTYYVYPLSVSQSGNNIIVSGKWYDRINSSSHTSYYLVVSAINFKDNVKNEMTIMQDTTPTIDTISPFNIDLKNKTMMLNVTQLYFNGYYNGYLRPFFANDGTRINALSTSTIASPVIYTGGYTIKNKLTW